MACAAHAMVHNGAVLPTRHAGYRKPQLCENTFSVLHRPEGFISHGWNSKKGT